MARDTKTRAQQNKAIRQDALREQLSKQGHLQHIVEIHKELLDAGNKMEPLMVQRLRIVMDSKHKLLDKYLPTERPTELKTELDGSLTIKVVYE